MQQGKRLLALLLTLALTMSLFAVPVMADDSYSDTHGHWAESSIERWSEYNIVSGSDGAFMPDASMTRGQMAKVLANMLGLTEETTVNPFSDVSASAWYAPYMLRCHAAGIMLGANGKGNPDAPVSRQEAMTMIARALNIEPLDASALDGYKDANGVADWAAGYVAALTSAGIVGGVGDSILAPTNDINRASVMKVFDKAISQYINAAGTYTLTDKAGIVLVAAGNVTLTGTTRADVLVSPAADNKAVSFDKATVTGKVVVQADNAKVTASADSKLPAPTMNGTGTTYTKTEKPKTSSGSSGGGSYTPPAPSSQTISATGTLNGGTYSSVTISDGVGDGEVTLSGVTINGDLTIKGGGSHSIILDGCTISGKVIFGKVSGEAPRMFLKGGTDANEVVVNGNAGAIIEAENSTSTVGAVEANKALEVRGSNTKVETITVPESATATVTVKDAEIKTVEAKGATTVKVDGAKIDDVQASGATATTIEQAENATSVSTIAKVTAASNVTIKTDVATVEVPETAAQKVEVTVDGGTVSKVEAKSEAAIAGTGGTVANVEATAAVSVDQSVVEKVTVPESATGNVAVAVSGSGSVDVEVNTTQNVEVTGSTGSVTVSTTSESVTGAITVGGQAVAHIHKWNAGVVTTPATCMAEGVKTFTCTDTAYHTGDHANDNTKTEVIAKTAHKLTAHAAVAATCETAGNIAYWTCSECNKLFNSAAGVTEIEEAATVVAALGHDFGGWTRLNDEKHQRVCSHDASHIEQEDHSWDAGVVTVEATTTEAGVKTYNCTVCDAVKTEAIPATGGGSGVTVTGEKNGFDIKFAVNGRHQLTATLVTPADRAQDTEGWIKYTYYFVNADGNYFSTSNVVASGYPYILSFTTGRYTAVLLFLSKEGTDFTNLTPVASWTLDKPIVASNGVAEFPHSPVTVTASPDTAAGREGFYNYAFTGLDFDNYSYTLLNPAKKSALIVNATPAASGNATVGKDWIGEGMQLRATSAKLENGTYYVTTTKAITVNVTEETADATGGQTSTEIRFEERWGSTYLSWDTVEGAEKYSVFLSKDGGTNWINASQTSQTFLWLSLEGAGTYNAIQVLAKNENQEVIKTMTSTELSVIITHEVSNEPAPVTFTPTGNVNEYRMEVSGLTNGNFEKVHLSLNKIDDSCSFGGTVHNQNGKDVSTVSGTSLSQIVESGFYLVNEHDSHSLSADGKTLSYRVVQRGDWRKCELGQQEVEQSYRLEAQLASVTTGLTVSKYSIVFIPIDEYKGTIEKRENQVGIIRINADVTTNNGSKAFVPSEWSAESSLSADEEKAIAEKAVQDVINSYGDWVQTASDVTKIMDDESRVYSYELNTVQYCIIPAINSNKQLSGYVVFQIHLPSDASLPQGT